MSGTILGKVEAHCNPTPDTSGTGGEECIDRLPDGLCIYTLRDTLRHTCTYKNIYICILYISYAYTYEHVHTEIQIHS